MHRQMGLISLILSHREQGLNSLDLFHQLCEVVAQLIHRIVELEGVKRINKSLKDYQSSTFTVNIFFCNLKTFLTMFLQNNIASM